MDVFDRRQAKVRELIRTRYDGKQTRFAEAIGRPQNYVSRMMTTGKNRKNIGEDLARQIEKELKLPENWLDSDTVGKPTGKQRLHGMEVSEEAIALAREWEKLDEPLRAQIQVLIESLVAKQIREKRPARLPTRPNA